MRQIISDEMENALKAMRDAVDELLETHAKLGLKVVVCDGKGNPKRISARYLLNKKVKCSTMYHALNN